MLFCEYCNVGEYNQSCTCTITNSNCPYVRKCNIKHCYEPLQLMALCDKTSLFKSVTPEGYNTVRFEKDGFLYVEVENDSVIMIKNTLDEIPRYVKLSKNKNGEYVLSV